MHKCTSIKKNYFYYIKKIQIYFIKFKKNPENFLLRLIKIIKNKNRTFKYDFQIIGGALEIKTKKNDIFTIKAHALDYDKYLEEEIENELPRDISDKPYAVYLDQISPNHPDYLISNTSIKLYTTKIDLIYNEINNFF